MTPEEMWLQGQGIDVTTPGNQALLAFKETLDGFHIKWLNQIPEPDAIESTLQLAKDAYEALRDAGEADAEVTESLVTRLGAYAATVGRAVTSLDDDTFAFCRKILLACSAHKSPLPHPERDFDYPGWSPAPRIEAAGGLPWLAAHRPDEEVMQAICALAGDKVPSVRFLLLQELWRIFQKSPEAYWSILEDRGKAEDNKLVIHALLNSLGYVLVQAEERSVDVLAWLTDRMLPTELSTENLQEASDTGVLKETMPLIVWLVVERGNSWAEQAIERLLRHPICYAEPIEKFASVALQEYVFPNVDLSKLEIVNRAMSLVRGHHCRFCWYRQIADDTARPMG